MRRTETDVYAIIKHSNGDAWSYMPYSGAAWSFVIQHNFLRFHPIFPFHTFQ